MKKRQFLLGVFAITMTLVFVGCIYDDPFAITPSMQIDKVSVSLFYLVPGTLTSSGTEPLPHIAEILEQSSVTLIASTNLSGDQVFTWSSDNEAVATVESLQSGVGVVTVVGAGNAVITVTIEEASISADSNVAVTAVVFYSQFGAVGDGETCDFTAIIAAHNEANRRGRLGESVFVRADPGPFDSGTGEGFTFYIAEPNQQRTVRIETDTDWRGAYFIIDDTQVQMHSNGIWYLDSWLFHIASSPITGQPLPVGNTQQFVDLPVPGGLTFQRGAARLDGVSLPSNFTPAALVIAKDSNTTHFIRRGANENQGTPKTDRFIIDRDGNIDQSAQVIWDFNRVDRLRAFPVDEKPLTIRGGNFTVVATNGTPQPFHYKTRGIRLTRSNTTIDGIRHEIVGDEDAWRNTSTWYHGFLTIEQGVNITVRNSWFSGQSHNDAAGTYGIRAFDVINLSFINTHQVNSITDRTRWGLTSINNSKNILYDNVSFSRINSHTGAHNVTIRNSQVGWQGILLIGCGPLLIENTAVRGNHNFIGLRGDFGSTWDGNVTIRGGTLETAAWNYRASIIDSSNDGTWNFGYPTFMPRVVTIDGFRVENHGTNPVHFVTNSAYVHGTSRPYPHRLTDTVFYRNITVANNATPTLPANLVGHIGVIRLP